MSACEKTLGYGGVSCPPATAGMTQVVYFANLNDISSWTAGATGLYTDVTMKATKGLYRFEIKKDSGRFHETLQGAEESLGSYDQDYEAMIASMSITARNAVDDSNGPDLVIFAPSKSQEVFIVGKDLGARMVENEADTNQDAYGERMIFRATQMREKRVHLLDTDYDTTIALLESLVIAS